MKLTTSCYAVTGLYFIPPWFTNAGFIVGKNKTLIIDTGASNITAQTIYGYAKAVQPDNEFLVINSEKHIDHIGGNGFYFEMDIPIYGHASIFRTQSDMDLTAQYINQNLSQTARIKNQEGFIFFRHSKIINPSHKINQEISINLGTCEVQVLLTPGHTSSNISIYHEKEKVLYCGDLILESFIPNLDEGKEPEWNQWLQSIDKIKNLKIDYIVPGHGNIIAGENQINFEIQRIQNLLIQSISEYKC